MIITNHSQHYQKRYLTYVLFYLIDGTITTNDELRELINFNTYLKCCKVLVWHSKKTITATVTSYKHDEMSVRTYYASTLFEGPSISHFSCSEQKTKRFCCILRRIFEFHQPAAVYTSNLSSLFLLMRLK
jgi:hypothetical protein